MGVEGAKPLALSALLPGPREAGYGNGVMHTGVLHTPDLTAQGKTLGYLAMPFSTDRSPYYQVQVPWCRLRHGSGARVLLLAGNHGDEYEGELTLARLMRRLRPEQVQGEITILPLANVPAVMAARRRSPLDAGNLNRAFPGDPAGPPTLRLADYLEHTLFPYRQRRIRPACRRRVAGAPALCADRAPWSAGAVRPRPRSDAGAGVAVRLRGG